NLTVNLVNDYKFWPAFIRYEAEEDASAIYYHFVTSIDNLNSIKVTPYSIQNFLFIKVEEGVDISRTASILRSIGGTNVYDVESQLFVKPDTPRYAILFSAINSTMLMSFAINAIILTLFAAIQLIERSKEIATMKAIGISTRQLLKLYITMYLALLLFSMIIGVITGFISSSMLMGVLSVNRTIPSFTMIYPFLWIIVSVSILVLAAAIGAIIPVFTTVKKEIGSELRQSA
ncbi:MAG: ABC transporter permease, partial [Candidatus Heimdallarchaeota archaeon]|nr:ABC transporter permease [Candidatus Heimdallarchaeota archaeon]